MFELIAIYLIGVVVSSIFINLCEWWFMGYHITLKDEIHPYHLLSWILIIFYIGINVNDYMDSEDNFIGKFLKWARNKILVKKRNKV